MGVKLLKNGRLCYGNKECNEKEIKKEVINVVIAYGNKYTWVYRKGKLCQFFWKRQNYLM